MSPSPKRLVGLLLLLVAPVFLAGCPTGPSNAIDTSSDQLDFARTSVQRTLDIWNDNPRTDRLTITITPLSPWISISANSVSSNKPPSATGPFDKKRVLVNVDRSQLTIGDHVGRIALSANGAVTKNITVLVTRDHDAIALSNQTLDFERSELPRFLEVWNNNPEVETFTLSVTPSAPWIVVNSTAVTSAGPVSASGPFDKQNVQVSINRSLLLAGEHSGSIVFASPGIVTRQVDVRVTQDQDGTSNTLNIVNPQEKYSDPYLIDFSFTLRDENGSAVIQEPGDFDIDAREGASPVPSETGVHVQRGTARQLRVALVLDYTLSMQSTEGAITAMEAAAKNTLLPALNEDALVSVTEFHRDDMPAREVVPFTFDRDYTSDRIDAIQTEIVQGFYSASAMLDAMLAAAGTFEVAEAEKEDRYIIVFTDGDDTSSTASNNDVVNLARARGIRIYAINFGQDTIAADLVDLTTRTQGTLFTAGTIAEFDESFQQIVRDLDGQYNLRWASLSRGTNSLTPGFTLALGDDSVSYTAMENFVPADHVGNGVLQGKLRFVISDNRTATTVFLRADYVPRFIRTFSLYLSSDTAFTVTPVDGDNDGLFGGWTVMETPDPDNGGTTLVFESPGTPLPFGTFGPMLRITYDTLLDENDTLFNTVYVDNSLYTTTGGQSFVVEGYVNTPPAG